MNNLEISQFHLLRANGINDRIAILRCDKNTENLKAILDGAVSDYVINEGYNEFIEISLDNPWMRIIVTNINELNYKPFILSNFRDVEFCEYFLSKKKLIKYPKVAILRGGLHSEKPIAYMNSAVSEYFGNTVHKQFIEIHLDNPWVRVVFIDMDLIEFEKFENQKINGSI